MSKTVAVVLVLIAVVAVFGYLYMTDMIPGLSTEATYVGISYCSDVQTGSWIRNYSSTITVETYKTRIFVWQNNCTVRTTTRNRFLEKLAPYNVTVHFLKSIKISNNETGEVYFYRVMEFTTGEDRKIEIYITKPIPEGTVLKIEIHVEITVTAPTLTWNKTVDKVLYTKYTNVTREAPYVSLTGKLAEVPYPTAGGIGIQPMIIALDISPEYWIQPTLQLNWQYNKVYVYLKKNGSPVTDITMIGFTREDLGCIVQATGRLSKDSAGNLWLDVELIKKMELEIKP